MSDEWDESNESNGTNGTNGADEAGLPVSFGALGAKGLRKLKM